MERTQIYFSKAEKESLKRLAIKKGISMAEVIREAVAEYLAKEQESVLDKLDASQGIWRDREDIPDSDEYVSEMRKAWFAKEDK